MESDQNWLSPWPFFAAHADWLRRGLLCWTLGQPAFGVLATHARAYLLLYPDTLTWPWSFDFSAPEFVSSYDILCFIERCSILGDKGSYCVCNCNLKRGGVNVTQDLLGELVQTELGMPDMIIGNVVKRDAAKGCLRGGAANRNENALRLCSRLCHVVMWASAIILQEHVGDQACIFTHCIVTVIVYWESLVNDLEHCVLILSDFPEAWIFLNKNTTSTAGWSQIQLSGSHFEAQSCKKIHGGNCSSGAIEVDTWHQCTPLRLWTWRWP